MSEEKTLDTSREAVAGQRIQTSRCPHGYDTTCALCDMIARSTPRLSTVVTPKTREEIADRVEEIVEAQNHVAKTGGHVRESEINPPHYQTGGIETMDYLDAKLTREEVMGFLKGNIIKYLSRAREKGGATDYCKAKWYLDRLVGMYDE